MHFVIMTFLFLGFSMNAKAEVVGQSIEYKEGSTKLIGYIAYDNAKTDKRPGVIVVPEWKGLNDYAKRRANELAQLGYVALAADIYGNGLQPKDNKEAAELAGKFKKDVKLLRARVNAALKTLKANKMVDTSKTFAIGYCFGGTTVLELARSGADVLGVVSFHGGLATPNANDAKKIKAKILALHGALDPNVSQSEVEAFQKEMNDAKVDYQFTAYSGAVHGFTNPDNGSDITKGVAYNAVADKRSWIAMTNFFDELLKK
jgi:dienelactone hydrolase